MIRTKTALRLLIAGAAVTIATALSGCSSDAMSSGGATDAPIGGDIMAPVTMSASDLQGNTVDLVIGQVLNITTGDLAVDSYSGEVEDPAIAQFVAGGESGGAEMNPGVEALAEGETSVTMMNENGGIQNLTFTVVVTPAE